MVAYAEEEPAFGIATVIIESSISFGDEDCISSTSEAGQEAEQQQETNDDDDDNESSSTDNAAVERGKLLKAFSLSFYNARTSFPNSISKRVYEKNGGSSRLT